MTTARPSIPKLGLWIAGIVVALAAAGIIIDVCTSGPAQTFGLHPDARGPAARRMPIVAHLAGEVYYYNPTPKARAIPVAALIGYNTRAAAEADGIRPSADAAEMTADLDRVEIKRDLRKGVLFELIAALSDDLSDLCDLGESDKIFLDCGVLEFNIFADGIVATWPMELLDAARGDEVKLEPVWTHLAGNEGIWRAGNAAARAIDSGQLAADLAGGGGLPAAQALVEGESPIHPAAYPP